MHYAFFVGGPLYGHRSAPRLMHFEIYAIRYYAFKTFRLYQKNADFASTETLLAEAFCTFVWFVSRGGDISVSHQLVWCDIVSGNSRVVRSWVVASLAEDCIHVNIVTPKDKPYEGHWNTLVTRSHPNPPVQVHRSP